MQVDAASNWDEKKKTPERRFEFSDKLEHLVKPPSRFLTDRGVKLEVEADSFRLIDGIQGSIKCPIRTTKGVVSFRIGSIEAQSDAGYSALLE